jgi:hypothetical protein
LPPACRWDADEAVEGAAERSLGLVADAHGYLPKAKRAFAQLALRQMHSPLRQVLDGCLANQFNEALGERRPRSSRLLCQLFHRPRSCRLGMQQTKGSANMRVVEPGKPAAVSLADIGELPAHKLREEQFRQPCQYSPVAGTRSVGPCPRTASTCPLSRCGKE